MDSAASLVRCGWAAGGGPLEIEYHDHEWGVPNRDDRHLFEMLVLEGAQAGLSWSTILRKRQGYRDVFAGFDPVKVAAFDEDDIERLLAEPGIVRNRRKIESAVSNARAALKVVDERGSLAEFLWAFVGGRPVVNRRRSLGELPAETPESQAMSNALRERGFGFAGPTICYAFMQAVGMVNDHEVGCFRYPLLGGQPD
ncbi:MAG: DNA-3-methyladenine glycosylase I [Actinomycetota bacterium]